MWFIGDWKRAGNVDKIKNAKNDTVVMPVGALKWPKSEKGRPLNRRINEPMIQRFSAHNHPNDMPPGGHPPISGGVFIAKDNPPVGISYK